MDKDTIPLAIKRGVMIAALLGGFGGQVIAAEPELPGLAALRADLDRQAADHNDTCSVVVVDRDPDHAFYVVYAQCAKPKYRCYYAVNGEDLDPATGMPAEIELLKCEPKPVDI